MYLYVLKLLQYFTLKKAQAQNVIGHQHFFAGIIYLLDIFYLIIYCYAEILFFLANYAGIYSSSMTIDERV